MPIRPENKIRYPADWPEISDRIRFERAGGFCECAGECGHHAGRPCLAVHGEPHPVTRSRVVLTTAHLDHTPENCHDSNLKAMCQRCHLAYDLDLHRANAAATRFARLTAGMTPLFEVTFVTTTAHILRKAADVLDSQPHLQLDAVTVVRIAAGPGRANHELAEQVLAELADYLHAGDGDPASALKGWSAAHTPEQLGAALHEAADMTEVIS